MYDSSEFLRDYEQALIRSEQEIWASPKRGFWERLKAWMGF